MNLTCKKNVIATFLCAVLTTPALVSASVLVEQQNNTRSVKVSYSDLNLNSPDGRVALYGRLKSAANDVCHSTYGRLTLGESLARKECVDESMGRALEAAGINNFVGMISQ
jgi:UrcA family protein